jgi:Trk K+ transport system NAD-binding subunit
LTSSFYQWEPNTQIFPGDEIVYIETEEHFIHDFHSYFTRPQLRENKLSSFISNLKKFCQLNFQQQIRRVTIFCACIVFILLLIGTILFKYYQETTFINAFYITAILLLGGYADLFGSFESLPELPAWLQLFSLGLTITGTAFIGVLYALLTQALLSSQFQFVKKRPSIPKENHIIIIGLGRVGQRVANLLQSFKESVLGITFNLNLDASISSSIPLIVGKYRDALLKANLTNAKSVVVVTDDEILNLEIGLMTQKINPSCNLVIRTTGQNLSQTLTQILPQAQIIAVYEVAAEAFAGAAFGENILSLFRFCNQTILVTEYQIEANDTLNGLLIAEVAYGYGVIPIFYASSQGKQTFMPSDHVCLTVGDKLVVLAFIEGLKDIEIGRLKEKKWQLRVESVISEDAAFEGANAIARISGCSLAIARKMMNNLPSTLPIKLYKHQGMRLVRILKKLQVNCSIQE